MFSYVNYTRYNSNPQVFDVISGNHDLDDNDPFEKSHDVSEIFVHPGYSPLKDEYNFALLRVRGKIVFNDAATLDICRPNRGDLFPGATEVWATGWGDTGKTILLFGKGTCCTLNSV